MDAETKRLINVYGDCKFPLLVLNAKQDVLVSPEQVKVWFNEAASEDKTYKAYEGAYHELLLDAGYKAVIQDVVDWVNQRA
jgi:alpha-beta hydrolase superfamily lysophospholipase